MVFAGMNYLAILLAAIGGFAFGAVYYGSLGNQWMAALGKTKEDLVDADGNTPVAPFIIAFVCQFAIAFMLAGTVGHLVMRSGAPVVTISNTVISALFIWAGFILTTQIVNHRFQSQTWALTIIDSLHWLGVLLVMAVIIGWFGV